MRPTNSEIRTALDQLNWNYGKGDIIKVTNPSNGAGKFHRRPFGLREEIRQYRISGRTVYACGHQLTIK